LARSPALASAATLSTTLATTIALAATLGCASARSRPATLAVASSLPTSCAATTGERRDGLIRRSITFCIRRPERVNRKNDNEGDEREQESIFLKIITIQLSPETIRF
jgi:hypothetical protein